MSRPIQVNLLPKQISRHYFRGHLLDHIASFTTHSDDGVGTIEVDLDTDMTEVWEWREIESDGEPIRNWKLVTTEPTVR